ncbi:hypothetical protein ACSDR0_44445 [Streptosporangium sp. G11]|uniref:hypothetical protein n=1 Tax=Streptosporangium sp. G11 TaxID=3436926 RepID=UPI003EB815E2
MPELRITAVARHNQTVKSFHSEVAAQSGELVEVEHSGRRWAGRRAILPSPSNSTSPTPELFGWEDEKAH